MRTIVTNDIVYGGSLHDRDVSAVWRMCRGATEEIPSVLDGLERIERLIRSEQQ